MRRPLLLLTLLIAAGDARASKPRCLLERIDVAELEDGKARFYASAVELEGEVIPNMPARSFTLLINGKPKGKAEKAIQFGKSNEKVDIAILVEVASPMKASLEKVKEALKDFLEGQSPSMRVMIIPYGSATLKKLNAKFLAAGAVAQAIEQLQADDDNGDLRMDDALHFALIELKKLTAPKPGEEVKPPLTRRLIVLISDGLNKRMDRPTIKALGLEAEKAGIPIHTIGFSPVDARGPLLNLGDLSKRSHGTFRWAKTINDLKPQLDNLAEEVRKQYVLTFPVELSWQDFKKKRFSLMCGELKSNERKANESGAPSEPPPSSWWIYLLIGLGGLFGLLILLFVIGTILNARKKRAPVVAGAVGAQAQAMGGGRTQQVAAPNTQQRQVAPPKQQAMPVAKGGTLHAVTGPIAGMKVSLERRDITIGKLQGHTLTIPNDASVSSNHCKIGFDGTAYTVTDLNSTNGTFVNGRQISGTQRLSDGDVLRIGLETQFKVRVDY